MFIVGDLHIQDKQEVDSYLDYLNNKKDKLIILLGDTIDFNENINNKLESSDDIEFEKILKKLLSNYWDLYKYFYENLEKKTISYLGTHEWFAIELTNLLNMTPNLSLKNHRIELMIKDFEEIKYGKTIISGLTIPGNHHPPSTPEFSKTKKEIEKYVNEAVSKYTPSDPKNTIICTHDPIDIYYRNQGLSSLTDLLERYPFKAHYHAHIHSNINNVKVNETWSINRSIIALAQFDPDKLKPISQELLSYIQKSK